MRLSEMIRSSGRALIVAEQEGNPGHPSKGDGGMVPDPEIRMVTDDSRLAGPGVLFAGTRTGRPYLRNAEAAGASALLVSPSEIPEWRRLLKNSGRESEVALVHGRRRPDFELGHLASALFSHPSTGLYMVAVTGTNGKTTTTHMLYHLWKKAGFHCALIGTLGVLRFDGEREHRSATGFTTPRSYELQAILRDLVDEGITHVTIEASSEALSLGRLEGLKIDTALFTGFGRDHLDHHGSMEAYLRAKVHLFFITLREPSPAFFIYREPTAEESLKRFARLVLRQLKGKRKEGQMSRNGDDYPFPDFYWIDETDLDAPLLLQQPAPTHFNRINALLALRAAERSGVPSCHLDLSDFGGVSGRMEHIVLSDGVDGFVDYAHSPDSLDRVLSELRSLGYGKVIVVFGCGGDRDPGKRPIMGEISARLADVMIVTDDNPRTEDPAKIRSQIVAGAGQIKDGAELFEVGDRARAIRFAVELALEAGHHQEKTVVLVTGKGHEDYQILGKEKRPFSDREEIMASLASLRFRP